ncbi:small multi-drug export protein [Candidatus Woesearchaeota archaeon]|nr:small multi-drug export protein [Candidatus Woesearchaeota archaeon]
MNSLFYVALLSVLPISELRGSIPLGFGLGLDPFLVVLTAVIFNFLAVFIVFFFMDNLHRLFLRAKFYRSFFDGYIKKNRSKIEKAVGKKTEFLALMILVAIPLPLTGAYTGSVLAWFFGISRRKAYLAIFLGVVVAALIMTLVSFGIFGLS